ncbi:hypothetical protein [Thiocapsa sp. N5-Cardenillas]|uniref:hypothetical protein n=1 Tax=Thiocapsa sp. N5-Cardenillas TaxID=3137397 RepID=UPI0035B26734
MRYTKTYTRRFAPQTGQGELMHYLQKKGMSPAMAEVFILRQKGRDLSTVASMLDVGRQYVANLSNLARRVVRERENTNEAITIYRCKDCCYRHGCLTFEGEQSSIYATVCVWFAEEGKK